MGEIYYLGGSPCCGKSTIAKMLADKYGYQYFKADDFLEDYIAKGATDKKPLLSKISKMTLDEIWLRNPQEQNREELEIYREMFEYVFNDLKLLDNGVSIVAEGAAFLPELMSELEVDKNHYICMVPTNEFQYEKYSKRPWVHHYLKGCSNEKLALENWMQRDYLFASAVLNDANKLGYSTLIVDGTKSIEINSGIVENILNLK